MNKSTIWVNNFSSIASVVVAVAAVVRVGSGRKFNNDTNNLTLV